jgi:dipeptidase
MALQFAALLISVLFRWCGACTTLIAGRHTTVDGSVMASHSNDGASGSGGRISRVLSASWPPTGPGSNRSVAGGTIPQVAHTYAYHTEGYGIMNEHQVGLGETTCFGIFKGKTPGIMDIIDLGKVALERTTTSRAAVVLMGELAERYGYNDNGESLMVIDPTEGWIFQVLPDDTGASAVWVAQRVGDDEVGAVANAFTIRVVDFEDNNTFLSSSSMQDVAERATNWTRGTPLDFTATFSAGEESLFYSGRRMWSAMHLMAPEHTFSPFYTDFNRDKPYPATVAVQPKSLNVTDFFRVMRDVS